MKTKIFLLAFFLLLSAGKNQPLLSQEPLPDTVWTYTSWPSQNFTSVLFSKDGTKIYTGGKSLKVFDSETGDSLLEINSTRIYHIAITNSGKYLATSDANGVINIWDTETWLLYKVFNDFVGNPAGALSFSPDEKLLAASSWNQGVKIWNFHNGEIIKFFDSEMNPGIYDKAYVEYSNDGKYLAITGEVKKLVLYNNITKELNSVGIESNYVTKFLPDNRYLIVLQNESNSPKLVMLDIQNHFSKVKEFKGHSEGFITEFKITPDGKYLISAGDDYTVRIWDIETGVNTYTYYNNWGPKLSVDFSSDNKYIITCTSGSLHLNNAKWAGTGVENPDNPIEIISNISSFPNPGNDTITLEYNVSIFTNLQIDIYDSIGNYIKNLYDGVKEPGLNHTVLDTKDIASGVYYVRFTAGEFIYSTDIVVNK